MMINYDLNTLSSFHPYRSFFCQFMNIGIWGYHQALRKPELSSGAGSSFR